MSDNTCQCQCPFCDPDNRELINAWLDLIRTELDRRKAANIFYASIGPSNVDQTVLGPKVGGGG